MADAELDPPEHWIDCAPLPAMLAAYVRRYPVKPDGPPTDPQQGFLVGLHIGVGIVLASIWHADDELPRSEQRVETLRDEVTDVIAERIAELRAAAG